MNGVVVSSRQSSQPSADQRLALSWAEASWATGSGAASGTLAAASSGLDCSFPRASRPWISRARKAAISGGSSMFEKPAAASNVWPAAMRMGDAGLAALPSLATGWRTAE